MNSNNQTGKSGFGGSKAGGFGGKGGGFGGFGGGFKVPQKQQQEVIIEEEQVRERQKMFDFDGRQIDASLGTMYAKDHRKTIMVVCVIIIAFAFGSVIGGLWQGVISDRAKVNTRIDQAQKVYPDVQEKVDRYQTFAQQFRQRSESLGAGVLEYNENFYNEVIKKYRDPKYDFLLDITTLDDEAITMASNALNNPLSDIRGYAAGTLALSKIIDSHIQQTEKDMDEIQTLLGTSSATDKNIVYALKVDPNYMMSIVDVEYNAAAKPAYPKANRLDPAYSVTKVYQVKGAITDDVEADRIFKQLKSEGKATDARNFKMPSEAEIKQKRLIPSDPVPDGLVVPNRVIYIIADQKGHEEYVFADELFLLDRKKLYDASPNALERYNKRMTQIIRILGDIEKTTDGLVGKLHAISTEDRIEGIR